MAESRSSGRYLAPALVACAAASAPYAASRGRAHHRSAVRCAGARGSFHRGVADIARDACGDLPAGQTRRQGPARPVGLRPQGQAGALAGRFQSTCAGRRQALRGGDRPPRAPTNRSDSPGSSSTHLRHRDGRCCFRSMAGSTTTTCRKRRRKPCSPITPPDAFATDATISPRGGYVAYVRDQNLHVFDLAGRADRALTGDGGGAIKNGIAEFIAQEEMDRSSGYWWAPDDRHIAFVRVDESPVKVTQRFEITADNVETFPQRYPAAGGPNVLHPARRRRRTHGRGDLDRSRQRSGYLPRARELAARRQDPGDPAREPRSAPARSAVRGHRRRARAAWF